jgi:flagella basal body P-ring formation protein FlgA
MRRLIFLVMSLVASDGFAKPEVTFLNSVETNGKVEILLSDIADINTVPKQFRDKWKMIKIAPHLKTGEILKIKNTQIASVLRDQIPKSELSEVQLSIPHEIVVKRISFEDAEKNITKQLLEYWNRQCTSCDFKIQSLNIPNLDKTVESWQIDFPSEPLRGTFNYPIFIEYNDKRRQQFWLNGQLKIFKKVPIVSRLISHGEKFSNYNIKEEFKDVTHHYHQILERGDILDRAANHTLSPGALITSATILREKAVSRGEQVKVLLTEDSYELTTFGKVQKDAYLGDRVEVILRGATQPSMATVQARGEVIVE